MVFGASAGWDVGDDRGVQSVRIGEKMGMDRAGAGAEESVMMLDLCLAMDLRFRVVETVVLGNKFEGAGWLCWFWRKIVFVAIVLPVEVGIVLALVFRLLAGDKELEDDRGLEKG